MGSKYNALRHGFRSSVALISGETEAELSDLRSGLFESLHPVGRLEEELAERAVSCLWRLRRINRLEAEGLEEIARLWEERNLVEAARFSENRAAGGFDRPWLEKPGLEDDKRFHDEAMAAAERIYLDGLGRSVGRGLASDRAQTLFNLVRRYEASLDRCLNATLAQLERIQSARKKDGCEYRPPDSAQPVGSISESTHLAAAANDHPHPASPTKDTAAREAGTVRKSSGNFSLREPQVHGGRRSVSEANTDEGSGTLCSLRSAPSKEQIRESQPPGEPEDGAGDDLTMDELRELTAAAEEANITAPALLRELRVIAERIKEFKAAGDPNPPDLRQAAKVLAQVRASSG